MSDFENDFTLLARQIADRAGNDGVQDELPWKLVVDLDLPQVYTTGSFRDHVALVRILAAHGLFSPLSISPIAAAVIGLTDPSPAAPLTVAFTTRPRGNAPVLTPTTVVAPWMSSSSSRLVLERDLTTRSSTVGLIDSPTERRNVKGSDRAPFETMTVGSVARLSVPMNPHNRAQLDVAVIAMLCGAAARATQMTQHHVEGRHQFDRPLVSHPHVSKKLGQARVSLTQATAALDRAVDVLEGGGDPGQQIAAVCVAREVVGQAATEVAMIAHQLHGAIGMTQEHGLGRITRHIWSFRDWPTPRRVARRLLGELATAEGPWYLWDVLTDPEPERAASS